MSAKAAMIVSALLENEPDVPDKEQTISQLERAFPSPEAELAGIQAWVKASSNATGEFPRDWMWYPKTNFLVLIADDGTEHVFTGEDVADAMPNDWRLNRFRKNPI